MTVSVDFGYDLIFFYYISACLFMCERLIGNSYITAEYKCNIQLFQVTVSLFVLRFYGPVNPIGSCRARSVYLTTCLLGRLSPLSG